jgi:hypothetical protein
LYNELKNLNTKRTNNPINGQMNRTDNSSSKEEEQMARKYMKKKAMLGISL